MILGFVFFIQTFSKHCKVLSTEKYRRYGNIFIIIIIILWLHVHTLYMRRMHNSNLEIRTAGSSCHPQIISVMVNFLLDWHLYYPFNCEIIKPTEVSVVVFFI